MHTPSSHFFAGSASRPSESDLFNCPLANPQNKFQDCFGGLLRLPLEEQVRSGNAFHQDVRHDLLDLGEALAADEAVAPGLEVKRWDSNFGEIGAHIAGENVA